MIEDLKNRFIKETEQEIDKKRKRVDELLEEAAFLDGEIAEARRLLQLLKSGIVEPPVPSPPMKSKTKPVRIPEPEFVELLKTLGEFTTEEVAKITGMQSNSVATRMNTLAFKGLAMKIQEHGFTPGEGAQPAIWKVTSNGQESS